MKLLFARQRLAVIVHFSAEDCLATAEPPADLSIKAKECMDKAFAEGQVEFYLMFEKRLLMAWQRMRILAQANAFKMDKRSVQIVLAAGSPPVFKNLSVVADKDVNSMAHINITASKDELRKWKFEWLRLQVAKRLFDNGFTYSVNPSHLRAALYLAKLGRPVRNYPVHALTNLNKLDPDEQGYYLIPNKNRGTVSVVILDFRKIDYDRDKMVARLERIQQQILKLPKHSKGGYKILTKHILQSLRAASKGPQSLGFEMPLVFLAAIDPSPAGDSHATVRKALSGMIAFEVSEDRMQASVKHFDKSLYARAREIDEEWFTKRLQEAGIVHGIKVDLLQTTLDRFYCQENLEGSVVAKGTPAVRGEGPFVQDMSAHKSSLLAKVGEQVAEIQYNSPPQVGKDVLGRDIEPERGEHLDVTVGEGIERRADGNFYATFSGLFYKDEAGVMALKKAFVYEGSVNNTTGDIDFDGPVEIKGDIDSGVKVNVRGDLTVHGEIRGGQVICKGNLVVERAIVSGKTGLVRVKGDIQADFIENSTVICSGKITVNKSILSSQVSAGVGIEVTSPSGVISGGVVMCGDYLKTSKLGLRDGAKTVVQVGVQVEVERAIEIRRKRLQKFLDLSTREQNQLHGLLRKSAAQLSKSNKQLKDDLQKRVTRLKKLVTTMTENFQAKQNLQIYNEAATLSASGTVAQNCEIKIAGKAIYMDQEKTNVTLRKAG